MSGVRVCTRTSDATSLFACDIESSRQVSAGVSVHRVSLRQVCVYRERHPDK